MVDISRHLEKAEEAVKKKNFRFAIQLYHQLLDLKPDDGKARRGLHEALERYGEYRSLNPVLAFLSTLGPRVSVLLARMARNHPSEARSWERVLAVDPKSKKALLSLSTALERAGFINSAQATYEHLARISPDDGEAWKRVGAMKSRLGDSDGALEAYEQALAVDPRDQEALRARKNLAAEGALARSTYRTATSSQELIKDKDKARELEVNQRVVKSEDLLQEELDGILAKLAESPDDPGLLLRQAEILRRSGSRQEALQVLERIQLLGAAGFESLRLKGDLEIEIKKGEIGAAREEGLPEDRLQTLQEELVKLRVRVARELVASHPTDSNLRFRLGEALEEMGSLDEAIAEFQQANKDPRLRTESLIRLARAFRSKGLADLAVGQYVKSLESLDSSGERGREVLYELGDTLEEKGDHQGALEKFSRIYEVDITFRDVSSRIERLNRTLGS